MVHRDLKPENLLYKDNSEDSVLKIGRKSFMYEIVSVAILTTLADSMGLSLDSDPLQDSQKLLVSDCSI